MLTVSHNTKKIKTVSTTTLSKELGINSKELFDKLAFWLSHIAAHLQARTSHRTTKGLQKSCNLPPAFIPIKRAGNAMKIHFTKKQYLQTTNHFWQTTIQNNIVTLQKQKSIMV